MTIEKYLQDKVDINEITESDRDFILKAIDKIENKKIFWKEHKYYIYRILSIFYIDYLNEVRVKRDKEDIFNNIRDGITKDKISELEIVLDILFFENVLRKDSSVFSSFYYLNTAVLNDNENIKDSKSEKSFIEPRVEAKNFLEAHFEAYQKYDEIVLNDIGMILTECFNFEANSDTGMINFKMNGAKAGSEPCNYNVYLSRGYICLEEEDNTCADNIWHADGIEMLIDLIKDLQEDEKNEN